MRFKKPRDLSLDVQCFSVLHGLAGFRRVKFIPNKLAVWEGLLRPSPFSKAYKVRIRYELHGRPDVTVPELDFSKKRPPHLFNDNTLCLYKRWTPGAWTAQMQISNLVPLISHWLWCYDLWKIDGKWHGEEFPHPRNEEKRK